MGGRESGTYLVDVNALFSIPQMDSGSIQEILVVDISSLLMGRWARFRFPCRLLSAFNLFSFFPDLFLFPSQSNVLPTDQHPSFLLLVNLFIFILFFYLVALACFPPSVAGAI